jgi:hypothetical protein
MPKYTFEQLMDMDIFDCADAITSMSVEERLQVVVPKFDPDVIEQVNKNLRESMKRTPSGKHLAEI